MPEQKSPDADDTGTDRKSDTPAPPAIDEGDPKSSDDGSGTSETD